MGRKRTIKIQDLNVDIAELQKKDPQILKKIRGGKRSLPIMLPTTDIEYRGCSTDPTDWGGCYPIPGVPVTRTYVCPPPPVF